MPSPWFQPHTHDRMRSYARCQMCARRLKRVPVRRRQVKVFPVPLIAVAPDIPKGPTTPRRRWITWEEVGIGLTLALGLWMVVTLCVAVLLLS